MALKVFDYACPSCDNVFEVMVRYRGEAVQCPQCKVWVQKARPAATRTTFKFADKSGMKRG